MQGNYRANRVRGGGDRGAIIETRCVLGRGGGAGGRKRNWANFRAASGISVKRY